MCCTTSKSSIKHHSLVGFLLFFFLNNSSVICPIRDLIVTAETKFINMLLVLWVDPSLVYVYQKYDICQPTTRSEKRGDKYSNQTPTNIQTNTK